MQLMEERRRRRWSQAELARRAGLNATTIGLIESRRFRPYPRQLAKLARALGWPPEAANSLLDPAIGLDPAPGDSSPGRFEGSDR